MRAETNDTAPPIVRPRKLLGVANHVEGQVREEPDCPEQYQTHEVFHFTNL
jgi:hypothetical protein